MNILYIDHYAGTPRMGMEFRPYYLAREWIRQGHNVRVVAGDYSHLRIKNPTVKIDFQEETIDGITYNWIKTGIYKGNGIARAFTMFRFVFKLGIKANWIANNWKPDVVITSSTYPLDSFAGNKIAKKAKAKYIHEAHDVWPLTLIELGGMSKYHPFVLLLSLAEKYAYKNAEKIVSVLPNSIAHMLECGLDDRSKFVYIPNGIAEEDWIQNTDIPEEHRALFNKFHQEGKWIVCFTGGITKFDKIDLLIEAAKELKDNNQIVFVIVGKGMEKEFYMNKAKEMGLNNLFFLPPVSKIQIPLILRNSDFLYLSMPSCSLYRYGVSINKLYDYMMAAKPIIYGVVAANNEVEEAGCGISFDPESVGSLCDVIQKMMNLNDEERQKIGEKGKKWVLENCEYKILSQKFMKAINEN